MKNKETIGLGCKAEAIVSFFMKITFDFPEVRTYLQIFAHLGHFQHDGAFDPFFVELAA